MTLHGQSFPREEQQQRHTLEELISALEKQMVRVEGRLSALEKEIQPVRIEIDALRSRIEILFNMQLALLGGMFALVGFVLWDRRSYVKPVKDYVKQIQESAQKTRQGQSTTGTQLLRSHGLL